MAAPSRETTSALIDYEFATLRVEAVKLRVMREGLTRGASEAFVEAQSDQTLALCAIDAAMRAEQEAVIREAVEEAQRAAS